jgi:acyl-coenzyme A thioesterase PaaI-like protein
MIIEVEGQEKLKTHDKINPLLSGDLIEFKESYAKVSLTTNDDMMVDDTQLVHGGFIFSGANYTAMCAINNKNVVLAGANTTFMAPAKLGDTVVFEARVERKDTRRRIVNVIAKIYNVKIFEGEFSVVILDKHILSIKLMQDES